MSGVGLTLCRGCCCGTARKRPGVDHAGQQELLQELVNAGQATLRLSECLGPCELANVVVVRPARTARGGGARAVWIGGLNDECVDELIAWVYAGGPGRAPLPPRLHSCVIPPDQR